jgi:hypothetical protein
MCVGWISTSGSGSFAGFFEMWFFSAKCQCEIKMTNSQDRVWLFSTLEEANEKLTSYESETTSKFCCVRSEKDFGSIGKSVSYHLNLS